MCLFWGREIVFLSLSGRIESLSFHTTLFPLGSPLTERLETVAVNSPRGPEPRTTTRMDSLKNSMSSSIAFMRPVLASLKT
jgi:hypothetical protein